MSTLGPSNPSPARDAASDESRGRIAAENDNLTVGNGYVTGERAPGGAVGRADPFVVERELRDERRVAGGGPA